jgi:hypothetical protein
VGVLAAVWFGALPLAVVAGALPAAEATFENANASAINVPRPTSDPSAIFSLPVIASDSLSGAFHAPFCLFGDFLDIFQHGVHRVLARTDHNTAQGVRKLAENVH